MGGDSADRSRAHRGRTLCPEREQSGTGVAGRRRNLPADRGALLRVHSEFIRERLLEKGIASYAEFVDSVHEGDVCILGNVFSRNFTHWHEEMMKLVVLEHAGIDCAYVISGQPAFARTLLELIGIPQSRILEVSAPTRFRHALYTTPVSYINVSDYPGVLLELRSRLLAVDRSGLPSYGPRLWLDRGAQTRLGRRLVNEEEVSALLEKYGFRRLDMGSMSVREQIATAAETRVMAGLHGSQFVHSQLMPPRSHVVECFSPLYLNPTYSEIYRVLGHRYSQSSSTNTPLFPYPHGNDVLVDCQQLELAFQTSDPRSARADRPCQAEALAMISASPRRGSQPNACRAAAALATRAEGSPGRRPHCTVSGLPPCAFRHAATTWETEWPVPVPRLKASKPSPASSRCSARRCASHRSSTWT